MPGPLITVKCDCGQVQYVAYPDTWECPECRRRWNTGQIPKDEYWGLYRGMRRYRIQAIAVAVTIGVGFAILAASQGPRVFGLAPIIIGAWFLLYMPRLRRKARIQARASTPRWELRPE